MPLINHFLEKYCSLCRGMPPKISAEYLEALEKVELPGNVRQLENLLRQALARRKTNSPLGLQDLPVELLAELSESESTAEYFEPSKPAPTDVLSYIVGLLETMTGVSRAHSGVNSVPLRPPCAASRINQKRPPHGITPRSVYNKMRKHRMARAGPPQSHGGFAFGGSFFRNNSHSRKALQSAEALDHKRFGLNPFCLLP
jgi:DNA-binding NtrC family response regulator